MSLEALTKKDLIMMIRELKTELAKKEAKVEAFVESESVVSTEELPLTASSLYHVKGSTKNHYVELKYDPITKAAKVVSDIELSPHMAEDKAIKEITKQSISQVMIQNPNKEV